MIVCLCHRVSDHEIARAVHSGTRCFDDLQEDMRVGTACGCCQDSAREVFDHACACSGAAEAAPERARAH